MQERRYSRYKLEDVWSIMTAYPKELGIEIVPNSTLSRRSVSVIQITNEKRIFHNAVILARSSDWYHYSLNCASFQHTVTCVIAGTHDSCIDRPVLAMDTMRWYGPKKLRDDFGPLQPSFDKDGNLIEDLFDRKRKTQYGHNMLVGALLQQRADARARLSTFRPSTRMRVEAEVRKLQKRRTGHPLIVPQSQIRIAV